MRAAGQRYRHDAQPSAHTFVNFCKSPATRFALACDADTLWTSIKLEGSEVDMSLQNNNSTPAIHAQDITIVDDSAAANERRKVQGTGHVRLSGRDATLLSQMRNQYRKVFGMYFDPFEFTGNDLYARATLLQSLSSGNRELMDLALQFLDGKGKPRLHRRAGRADLEFDPQAPNGAK
jgi:hypothetical protein